MPYHLTTLLNSKVADAEAFMTRKEAVQEHCRRELTLTEDNLRLLEERAESLRRSALDLDLADDVRAQFTPPFCDEYTYRVDRCVNSLLCEACLKAGFDQEERWPRRDSDWQVIDRTAYIEIVRLEARILEDDEEAAAFVVQAAQNPGTPEAVRRECLLALEEILACAFLGIEDWRQDYGGPGRWRELLESQAEDGEDMPCACKGTGFLIMNADRYDTGEALGELQTCDTCKIFPTDEDAADAARATGYTVSEEGLVLSEPCRQRALRR